MHAARSFYVTLSEIADHVFHMWVGVLYYMSYFNSTTSSVAVAVVRLNS